jgi:hypothetical protein
MKGILKKTKEGWFVVFDQRTMQDPSAEDMVLPLEPKMANYLDMNLTSTTYQKEKEFEEIELLDRINQSGIYIFKKYAKIVETDEKGKPLTYWGGLKDRTCDHTNCREVCPECRPYHVSEDCEEVKNWDSFVEQKNLELLAEEVCGKGVNHDYEEGYVDGYNKAKEVLYTKEEMLECWNTSIIDITTFETFIELLKHPKK